MSKQVYTIGLVAPVDAGKTTLTEALLYKSNVLKTPGRVDYKNTFLDTDQMEKARGITIFSKTARFTKNDKEIVLVDTPGHIDFGAETERALAVLDAAILVVNCYEMVRPHTKTLWSLLKLHNIPTYIFVNKTDLNGADRDACFSCLLKELSKDIVDFTKDKETVFEAVSLSSEKLMENYLETGGISDKDIGLAIKERKIFPCLFGSALEITGIDELMNTVSKYIERVKIPELPSFYTYKISRDDKGVRLSHIRCFKGSLAVKELLGEEKVNEIRIYNGEGYMPVGSISDGEVFVIPNLKDTYPGKFYGDKLFVHSATLEPAISSSVIYPKTTDRVEMLEKLRCLCEEEPGLNVNYVEETSEIMVNLMGEVQKEIIINRLKNEYGVEVEFGKGRINYKETIEDTVEGVGHFEPLRHYAEVHLKLEPGERGSGITVFTDVSTDDLSLNWQRLIVTHIKERVHKGVLTASPLTDVKITLVAGKAHIKHTEGGDFRQATYRAVRQGLMQASSVLLEPWCDFSLIIPTELVGRAMTDLERLYAVSEVTETLDGVSVLTGNGPFSTLNGYAQDVTAYTRGRGVIYMTASGYKRCHNSDEVIEERAYNPENDIRNTPDSVFCSFKENPVVKWDKVFDYMHLPLTIYKPVETADSTPGEVSTKQDEIFLTTEEVDEIINKTAYSNKKSGGAYKGISAALYEKRRIKPVKEIGETVYKGTKHKERYLLIDGYNLIYSWPELREVAQTDINAAAGKLMDLVSNYKGLTDYEVILVFDAYKVLGNKREEFKYCNINVVYTKTAETADRYIERFTHENGNKFDITVVTSDGVEQVIIRGNAALISSREFVNEYERALKLMREQNGMVE